MLLPATGAVLHRCKGPVIVLTQRLLILSKIDCLVSLNYSSIGILKDYFNLIEPIES